MDEKVIEAEVIPEEHRKASAKAYNETDFWKILTSAAKTVGREVCLTALKLFYVLKKPETPAWAKTAIMGALGYFILPFDAIPDFIPVAGMADDIGVLTLAAGTVAMYIDDDVVKKATEQYERIFGR